jgi:hypothetical protein
MDRRRRDNGAASWLACLLVTACASADRVPRASSVEATAPEPPVAPACVEAEAVPASASKRVELTANPWAESAREVLKKACGKCHRSDVPTGVPAALQIYDLTESPWYARLRVEQLDRLLARVQRNEQITASDKTLIDDFVRYERERQDLSQVKK